MEKVVASRSLTSVDWEHSRLLDGPLEDAVAALKQGDGGPILIAGSRSIVQPLLTAGLVDELHLQVFPLLLGSGMRLYPETPQKTPLQLVASRALENGVVLQTYGPSRSDVACVIVANEALGGKSVAGVIYQGKARSKAPALTAAYPKVLVAGRTTTFAMKLANRTEHKLVSSQVLFGISPPRAGSPVVQARQLQLSVSRSGPRGPFVPVDLGGSLAGGGSIVGLIGGEKGFDVPSGRTSTLTFRLRATRGAPRGRRSILQFQSVLEQVNPATGASAQLGYTNASNARIR